MRFVLTYRRSISLLIVLLAALILPSSQPHPGSDAPQAIQASLAKPAFASVGRQVAMRGDATVVETTISPVKLQVARWIEAPGSFSLPIVQQPPDDTIYVANRQDQLTQFKAASQYGVTGLLAHDYLSGKEFYNLSVGQVIYVTYEDDFVQEYQVSAIHSYQKLEPENLYSDFIDLADQEKLSESQVFGLYYLGSHHLTLQTCLARDGRLDWGLYFVVASPYDGS